METTNYAAGWNLPGYLPDTCESFETFEDARAFLIDALQTQADSAENDVDAKPYEDEAASVEGWTDCDTTFELPDGYVYFIDRVNE